MGGWAGKGHSDGQVDTQPSYLSFPLKLCRKRMYVEVFCEVQEYVENCNSLTLCKVLEVDRGLG